MCKEEVTNIVSTASHTVQHVRSDCCCGSKALVLKVRPASQWRPAETFLAARNELQLIVLIQLYIAFSQVLPGLASFIH